MYKIEDFDSEDVKIIKKGLNKKLIFFTNSETRTLLDDRSNWVSALFTLQQCASELVEAIRHEVDYSPRIADLIEQYDSANVTAEQLIGIRETPDVSDR